MFARYGVPTETTSVYSNTPRMAYGHVCVRTMATTRSGSEWSKSFAKGACSRHCWSIYSCWNGSCTASIRRRGHHAADLVHLDDGVSPLRTICFWRLCDTRTQCTCPDHTPFKLTLLSSLIRPRFPSRAPALVYVSPVLWSVLRRRHWL